MDSSKAAAAFTRLTELADLLLNAGGELGIYSNKKEQLERFANAVLPQTDLLAAAGGADDADDMFADEDNVKTDKKNDVSNKAAAPAGGGGGGGSSKAAAVPQAANGSSTAAAVTPPAAPPPAAAAAAAAGDGVDYSSWPVKELRRFLTERGADSSNIVEKGDLVAQVGAGLMSFEGLVAADSRETSIRLGYILVHQHYFLLSRPGRKY